MMYAFSFNPWSIHPVICDEDKGQLSCSLGHYAVLTTRVEGNLPQNVLRPSGDEIWEPKT